MNERPLHRPVNPKTPPATAGFALWNLGFRPFYLLASVFSAFSVLLWEAQISGHFPSVYLQGPVWHGHEMLFGYTTAVIELSADCRARLDKRADAERRAVDGVGSAMGLR